MKTILTAALLACAVTATAQNKKTNPMPEKRQETSDSQRKVVVYQVFTRLFGNKKTANKPWGTAEVNGVGKFNDFTDKALYEIRKMGVTHIWYTGVPHHAMVHDYTAYGISNDDPDVVKGRAGSPYAVKDYYNVDPDLAVDPAHRLEEFEALIARTHRARLKVIIDIVPNHVARKYEGRSNPAGVVDFGANDDKSVEYKRDNNFYYIPGKPFLVPRSATYRPLNGERNPLIDQTYTENPAKWTGNGSREQQPSIDDWYETVKINYGVRPDGTKDFPTLPANFANLPYSEHYRFWQDKDVPDSWKKFRDIALYWIGKGVDGFRYDMAEMVPYEFWSYMNSAIKMRNPDAFLMAEVYNPKEYRNYINFGKMDYLYDKVGTYDLLKEVIRGKSLPDPLTEIQAGLKDIEHHMLHFLDNHDEQRLASGDFAGTPEKGLPLMVYSATVSTSPTMIYFGQEVGEAANEDAGFGKKTRTSIFDYIGVPSHQRWMNNGEFDGGQLSDSEKSLRDYYSRLLTFTVRSSALMGQYASIQQANRDKTAGYREGIYAFVRWSDDEKLVIVNNFSWVSKSHFNLMIPSDIITKWGLKDGKYIVEDQLFHKVSVSLVVERGVGHIEMALEPSQSFIFKIVK